MYGYNSYSNYGSTGGLGGLFAGMGILLFFFGGSKHCGLCLDSIRIFKGA